jgi:uncharacterized protein YkwD
MTARMIAARCARLATPLGLALTIGLLAAAVAGVLSTSIRRAEGEPVTVNCTVDATQLALTPEEQALLIDINSYRAAHGFAGLQRSPALTVSALWKANDMAMRRYDAHDDGFRTWAQRFRDCGYVLPGVTFGENLAAGYAGSEETLQQWQASPPHDANLLDPAFTAVGIKRVPALSGDPYGWYWTMDFGSRLDGIGTGDLPEQTP